MNGQGIESAFALHVFLDVAMILGVPCACYCAWQAVEKRYNLFLWFFGGLFFNLIALITIAGAPTNPYPKSRKDPAATKTCIACGTSNPGTNLNCVNCGARF